MTDFSKKFVLQMDACRTDLAAVLLQDFLEGSRLMLQVEEQKYSLCELETLGVLFGVKKFMIYNTVPRVCRISFGCQ